MDRYKQVKRIGQGNYGAAYLCEDLHADGHQVVVKKVPIQEMTPDEKKQASQEVNNLAAPRTAHNPADTSPAPICLVRSCCWPA